MTMDNGFLVFYSYFTKFFFVTDTIGFVFVLYLVKTRSKTMGKYRWYLLLNFVLSYNLGLLCCLFEPIPLQSNMIAMYFDGVLGKYGIQGFMLFLSHYFVVNISLLITILYRFMQLYVNWLQKILNTYHPLINIIFMYFLYIGGAIVPLSLMVKTNYTTLITTEAPDLLPYIEKPGFFAYSINFYFKIMLSSNILCAIFSVLYFFITLFLFQKTLRKRIREKKFVNSIGIQKILFKAIVVQCILAFLFYILPAVLLCLLLILKSPYANYAGYFLFMAFSSHATMEYISQIYFITPYRKCFLSLFMKRTNDKATENKVTMMMVNLKIVPNNSKISARNS